MNQVFKDKVVCFLGASNLSNGLYTYNLRSFLHRQKERCYVFNRGTAGNRADMAFDIIDEDVFALKPDFCVFSYGVNDMGIWLYDSFKEQTHEILAEREKRDQNYYNGVKDIVKRCKDAGVVPVLMSCNAVNEMLEEKPDIPTVGDNKEKAQLLGPWFYKRKTFKALNEHIRVYNKFLKDFAEKEGLMFFDTFSMTYEYMLKCYPDMYASDGIHITRAGNKVVAKAVLECMGYSDVPLEFEGDEQNDEIRKAEQLDRSARFVKNNMFNKVFGDFTEEDIVKECKRVIDDPNETKWMKDYCETYLRDYPRRKEFTEKVVELTMKY